MVLLPASSFARLLIPRSKLIGPATLGLIGIVTKHPKPRSYTVKYPTFVTVNRGS
jgi:hypothetical protein